MQRARVGDKDWDQWSTWSSKELVQVAEQVCDMLQEIRAFGLYFLRGLVPWIGFTIYTAVGTMLYFYHFPNLGDTNLHVEKRREHIVEGLLFLKDMRQAWPMADTWVSSTAWLSYAARQASTDFAAARKDKGNADLLQQYQNRRRLGSHAE
jgi:hypothetical protein